VGHRRRQLERLPVIGRFDGLGHQRLDTLGANHDLGAIVDASASSAVSLGSNDSIVVPQQRLDGEPFPQFRASFNGGVHEQPVQHRAAWTEAAASGVGVGHATFERKWTDVEDQATGDWWAPGCLQSIEQPPAIHDLGTMRPDDVRGNRVARKRGLIDQQDSIAVPSDQHRGRSAGAPGAHDDRVVHVSSFRSAVLTVRMCDRHGRAASAKVPIREMGRFRQPACQKSL
jgi:hypothetical protein